MMHHWLLRTKTPGMKTGARSGKRPWWANSRVGCGIVCGMDEGLMHDQD